MTTSSQPQACRCTLHMNLAARRHECYRQLARTILGPAAPSDDRALARALAEHARLLSGAGSNLTQLPFRRDLAA